MHAAGLHYYASLSGQYQATEACCQDAGRHGDACDGHGHLVDNKLLTNWGSLACTHLGYFDIV